MACKVQVLEAEQMREVTLIEHSKIENKKVEEITRINNEFDRIQCILSQRKHHITDQLGLIFNNLEKNLISDIATAASQTDYTQHLLTRLTQLYEKFFAPKPIEQVRKSITSKEVSVPVSPATSAAEEKKESLGGKILAKKISVDLKGEMIAEDDLDEMVNGQKKASKIDILSLNKEINETLPKLEKELEDLKQSFSSFSYIGNKYPQVNINRTYQDVKSGL